MPDNNNDEGEDRGTTCCICLEALLCRDAYADNDTEDPHQSSMALGCTVPCGHVFHYTCLEQLAAYHNSSSNRGHRGGATTTKCPMCNHAPIQTVKLFLDIPKNTTTNSSYHHASPETIVIDEDSTETITNQAYRALQQQTATYRQKWQTAKENLSKQAQRLQRHTCEVQEWQDKHQQAECNAQRQEQEVAQRDRQLETLRLERVTLQNKCQQLERQATDAEERATRAAMDLRLQQERHAARLRQAQDESLHELKHLATRNPQLEQENQALRKQVQKLQAQIQKCKPKPPVSGSSTLYSTDMTSSLSASSGSKRRNLLQHMGAAQGTLDAGFPKVKMVKKRKLTQSASRPTERMVSTQELKRQSTSTAKVMDATKDKSRQERAAPILQALEEQPPLSLQVTKSILKMPAQAAKHKQRLVSRSSNIGGKKTNISSSSRQGGVRSLLR